MSRPVDCCILAVAHSKKIDNDELEWNRKSGNITEEEFRSIKKIDLMQGNDHDLKVIKKLAEKLDLNVEVVSL